MWGIQSQTMGRSSYADRLADVCLLLKALQYVRAFNGVILQIPDDKTIGTYGLMNAFTDGINPVQSAGLLLKALQYVRAFNGVILQIPDDKTIGTYGLMNAFGQFLLCAIALLAPGLLWADEIPVPPLSAQVVGLRHQVMIAIRHTFGQFLLCAIALLAPGLLWADEIPVPPLSAQVVGNQGRLVDRREERQEEHFLGPYSGN
ncbi:hypothetical protein [Mycobacterium tuberculosis]|uniref:hypothetical protein n=1 Tax=Mycobacterium tuberculosis TaxID=1773 RepID=UPI00272C5692|nr:hypothetical protein [Mycobacterium tuberculosis]